MSQDFYNALGVKRNASDKEIRSAYRRLARKLHPDVNPGNQEASEQFKRANEAYQVLSDEKTRRDYDEFGENWRHAEQIRSSGMGGGFGRGRGRGRGAHFQQFDFSDLGDLGGFGSLGDLFRFGSGGGARGQAARSRQQQELDVQITLSEAFNGATRVISSQAPGACESCGGVGRRGSGVCAACGGSGVEVKPSRLEVKIPPGIDDGGRIRVRPNPGLQLTLRVRIRPDSRFTRRGNDLHVEVPVPYLDAILGGEAEVPTMTGRVALTVPSGSQNGRPIRLSGRGMPRLGGGDPGALVATLKVVLPESLDDEEKRMYERLRAMRDGHGNERE